MGKINSAAFTGFLLCFVAIVFGIVTNGGIASVLNLIHIPSAIVTFGGALFATLMTADSFSDFQEGLTSFATAFKRSSVSVYELAEQIFQLSETGRKEGLLALEEEANKIEFDFLKKAITLVVDGSDPELVRDILESEMIHKEERNKKNINFWQDLGAYGPAWGMLGTLLGLIDMMKSMGTNVDAIGSGMALALITTLYGSMLANWICIPIGRKLEKTSNEELLIMEVVTEGVLSIQAGENTRIIREKIKSVIEMESKEEDNA
ncbi:MAG: MotA/TolQ/ExbB proton channel family protein [Agathobacter sp.]|nr:MotA/TolQ/ExbB proton channel family protein [Agathobacter sp.]